MRLNNKVFVVTGGGNGIGRQVGLLLLRKGAHVALIDRDAAGLRETVAMSGAGAARASTHMVDLTDRVAVEALPAEVLGRHGRVDGLVNVAGMIHRFVPVEALTSTEAERVLEVNLWATVRMTLAFLPELKRRPSAALVNVSSLSALVPFAGQTFYSATKGAVKQFSEGLYQELAGTKVAVTTVFPGNISSNISANSGVTMIDAGGRRVSSTTPERAAREILAGVVRGRFRVVIGRDARMLDLLVRMAPGATTRLIGRQMASVL